MCRVLTVLAKRLSSANLVHKVCLLVLRICRESLLQGFIYGSLDGLFLLGALCLLLLFRSLRYLSRLLL